MWLSVKLKILLFLFACLLGVLVAFLWREYEYKSRRPRPNETANVFRDNSKSYQTWLKTQGLQRELLPEEWTSYKTADATIQTEAKFLFDRVTVLCLVMSRTKEGAKAIKDTWSSSCNRIIFWADFNNDDIPIVKLPIDNPVCALLNHIIDKVGQQLPNWLFFTDDETFAVIENLRYYVATLNSSKPYYLGHAVQKQFFSSPYNLLDAGALISKGAFKQISRSLKSSNCTSATSPSDFFDQDLGKLMSKWSDAPHAGDTRDTFSRGRFNPFSPSKMIIPGLISVFDSYWRSSLYLSNEGSDCCSDNAISFHGITPVQMHLLQYLIQSMSVFKGSLKGLGNDKPKFKIDNSYAQFDNDYPMVKLLSLDKIKNKQKAAKKKLKSLVYKGYRYNEVV